MAYFIISKFALSDFLRFWDNRVFLKIAERRGVRRMRIRIRVIHIRARRARLHTHARATASNTDILIDTEFRGKIVGKTNGRTASYLCGHTA